MNRILKMLVLLTIVTMIIGIKVDKAETIQNGNLRNIQSSTNNSEISDKNSQGTVNVIYNQTGAYIINQSVKLQKNLTFTKKFRTLYIKNSKIDFRDSSHLNLFQIRVFDSEISVGDKVVLEGTGLELYNSTLRGKNKVVLKYTSLFTDLHSNIILGSDAIINCFYVSINYTNFNAGQDCFFSTNVFEANNTKINFGDESLISIIDFNASNTNITYGKGAKNGAVNTFISNSNLNEGDNTLSVSRNFTSKDSSRKIGNEALNFIGSMNLINSIFTAGNDNKIGITALNSVNSTISGNFNNSILSEDVVLNHSNITEGDNNEIIVLLNLNATDSNINFKDNARLYVNNQTLVRSGNHTGKNASFVPNDPEDFNKNNTGTINQGVNSLLDQFPKPIDTVTINF